MASGDPFVSSDVDEWLYSVLSVDPLMQTYAPGGFWNHPDQISNDAWSASITYKLGDSVVGSDGQFYRSLQNGNTDNDPTATSGFWADCFPCVRWWQQTPGSDLQAQTGRLTRIESDPRFVVCMLDRQRGGMVDVLGGTNGHLKAGQLRLNTLLHARNASFTTSDGRVIAFNCQTLSPYGPLIEPVSGDNDVNLGHWYQIRAQ